MVYIRYCWQKITKHTVIYGVYIRFLPTLNILRGGTLRAWTES